MKPAQTVPGPLTNYAPEWRGKWKFRMKCPCDDPECHFKNAGRLYVGRNGWTVHSTGVGVDAAGETIMPSWNDVSVSPSYIVDNHIHFSIINGQVIP